MQSPKVASHAACKPCSEVGRITSSTRTYETRLKNEQEKRPQSRRHEEKLGPSSLDVVKQVHSYARASDRQAPTCATGILGFLARMAVVGSLHHSAGAYFSSTQLPDTHEIPSRGYCSASR